MTAAGSSHAYRADVDGLRAVAVLAVLAFHAFPHALPGGFAGVDVFFVISGFLISGIIFDDLARGRFTFANFYWRRIRRIFPALILVLAGSLALGWLVLLPDEYRQLGKHVAAGAGFIANLALYLETGYFDGAAELKPLLHLWSLGVEEQYYMVWPLLLVFFRRWTAWIIVGVGLASFAVNLYLTAVNPSAAFYLPVTRFWELLIGSALAYQASLGRRSRESGNPVGFFQKVNGVPAFAGTTYSALGAALLIAGLVLLNGERPFPGWWALLPVAGTALLISAGPNAWVNRTILAHPAAVGVGLISYPLYLWHWPLLSFSRIVEGGEPGALVKAALLILSFALAWATYQFVEKPVRFGALVRRLAVPALAASMVGVGFGGVAALKSAIEPQSAALPLVNEISRASADWQYRGDKVIPGDTAKAVLFFGDSHMQHYWPRIEKVMTERTAPVRTVIFKTTGGCAPVPGIERKSTECSRFVDEALALAQKPEVETVVIAASWVGFVSRPDYYRIGDQTRTPLKVLAPGSEWVLAGFEAAVRKLVASGKRVAIVLSSPRGEAFDPKSLVERDGLTVRVAARHAGVPRTELSALTSPIDERLRRIAAATGAAVIDPAEWLCSPTDCPTADEQGRPLYKDATHLRAAFARERFGAIDQYVYSAQ
jgi:peptidoglycan/LPS O-acetylase OafA/YrhL